jgi:hypothetical protein
VTEGSLSELVIPLKLRFMHPAAKKKHAIAAHNAGDLEQMLEKIPPGNKKYLFRLPPQKMTVSAWFNR